MAVWSELPWDPLSLIAERLTLLDFIRFGAVCTSWWLLYKQRRYPGSAPWLIVLDNDGEKKTTGFFSISDQRTHHLMTAELCGKRCWGCSNGWLVTLDINLEMNLVQPFSGIQMRIPSPPPLVENDDDGVFSPEDLLHMNISKVFLSSDPISCPEDCVIMAIHGARGKLAFLRLGDENWTFINDTCGVYMDVFYFRGLFIGVTSKMYVNACELGPDPKTRKFAAGVWGGRGNGGRRYLVESEGDLLCIIRNYSVFPTPEVLGVRDDSEIDSDDSDAERVYYVDRVQTTDFEVLKLDMNTRTWVKVRSLGEKALFVGQGTSMSLLANNLPGCKANSIYFTDDEERYSPHHGYYDLGVYSLGDKTVEPFYPSEAVHPLLSPPSWFFPSHLYTK